mmetsp:Transcript_25568/g.64194  ORF Transcript_25568/g.64194 Transcript_25568/m.64194 type:complete len:768 (-) Transcript_25568:271-2574(-)|eukprot:CAMPEP_0177648138 /NCGR_PEP_ID=MMETSP0447-20121125/10671_1 /TAXON_ID=0 /ORGANISM="Stygamoeba regulata, Strain BSH-02190019" /LENGTH=767 /DNA_ID=CAMNT_0019150765 /DNA_START=380 /DNA_END=2683 /DNA_ORIENTATION=+
MAATLDPEILLEETLNFGSDECVTCDPSWSSPWCLYGKLGCQAYNALFAMAFATCFSVSIFHLVRCIIIKNVIIGYRIHYVKGLALTVSLLSLVQGMRSALLVRGHTEPVLFHVLDLLPYLLIFSNLSILMLCWTSVYHGVASKGKSALERIPRLLLLANVVFSLVSVLLLPYAPRLATVVPSVATVVGSVLFVRFAWRKYLKFNNIKLRISTTSIRFRKVTLLTAAVLSSQVVLLLLWGTLSLLPSVLPSAVLVADPNASAATVQILLRAADLAHVIVVLMALASIADVSHLSLPVNIGQLTNDWLTTVLRSAGLIDHPVTVLEHQGAKAAVGGCHAAVQRIGLTYSGKPDRAPSSVVVKTCSWDKSLAERLRLYSKKFTGVNDKPSQYVRSYQIEARFYRNYAHKVRGIQVPHVYYNLADSFNVKFGMVMQDVGSAQDGQPNGFSIEHCRLLVKKLAQFHARFWQHPRLQKMNVWQPAGYWTGDKREADKRRIRVDWEQVVDKYTPHLTFPPEMRNIGERLERHVVSINTQIATAQPQTLLHGDFKVSNVFISASSDKHKRRNSADTGGSGDDCERTGGLSEQSALLSAAAQQQKKAKKKKKRVQKSDPKSKQPVNTKNGSDSKKSSNRGDTGDDLEEDNLDVYAIDWQWFGIGLGATELAHFLSMSACDEALEMSTLKSILKLYHRELLRHGVKHFAWKTFWQQYQLSIVDFFMYIVVSKWANMSVADINEHAATRQNGLVLRSFPHMKRLSDHALRFANALEL